MKSSRFGRSCSRINSLLDIRWIALATFGFVIALGISGAISIAISLSALIVAIGIIRNASESARISQKLDEVWPEVIDHLISGILSGMSLTESFLGLEERGPTQLRPIIGKLREGLYKHGDFEICLYELKEIVGSPSCDQICEAMLLARSLGGSELLYVLRTLGDYLRVELATRREIDIKHGWIKNSAHLSAVAPWLLLLLLATQRTTSEAFSTSTGVLILMSGVIATCVAYLWMNFLARLPRSPRVFGSKAL